MAANIAPGNVCLILATTPALSGCDTGPAVQGYVAQGDLIEVVRVARNADGAQLLCFEMGDGAEAWCSFDPDLIELIPDVADNLMDKILCAFEHEDAEHAPGAALSEEVVEEASPPATRGAEPVDPGGELERQTSVHGAGYDALVERGVPGRMLKRAWVMGGGDMDAA